jgi:hypothetical protein
MDELLAEFGAIFTEPFDLPPPRQLCHRIRLLPGTTPVAVRPYRYARGQKAELERQCTEMLQQDVIRPSSLTFSAPVLVKFLLDHKLLTLPRHLWVSKLLGFDFWVEFKPGLVDALSHHDTRRWRT